MGLSGASLWLSRSKRGDFMSKGRLWHGEYHYLGDHDVTNVSQALIRLAT